METAGPPLAGFRVLDLTRILSGPYASMLLADLGAEVVKVERPGSGDDTRSWGPPFLDGMSTYFAAVNRGKRSVAIDLRTSAAASSCATSRAGRRRDRELRPGVTERLGMDYASLARRNPALIYASITGFGSHGPKASEAGTEVIVEAETGLMAMMGTPDGPRCASASRWWTSPPGWRSSAACSQRRSSAPARTRPAARVPLYATAFSCLATVIASASVDPSSQGGRWGSGHPSIVPYSAFEASDGFVVLGAINELMWERLCEAFGLDELRADPRAASNEERVHNRAFVEAAIAAVIAPLRPPRSPSG